jgi:hypothetical protein
MTNWEKYFGTPERAADMRAKFFFDKETGSCAMCVSRGNERVIIPDGSYLDWLNSEAN